MPNRVSDKERYIYSQILTAGGEITYVTTSDENAAGVRSLSLPQGCDKQTAIRETVPIAAELTLG